MPEAYIVDAVRTAGGRRNGRLSGWHPVDLSALTLDAILERTAIDPAAVEDVIMGCVTQGGEQSLQIGRHAVLASKLLPLHVPAVTLDRQCGSSQQAIHFAAQGVMSGTQDVVMAAGIESMTRAPALLALLADKGYSPYPQSIRDRFGVQSFNQYESAEMVARKYGFTRRQCDEFALQSHVRAVAATEGGAFADEIIPVPIVHADGTHDVHAKDEGIRYNASLEAMTNVKVLREGGLLTAATSSQVCDGASAVLVVSERALQEHGLKPKARIINMTVTAGDPVIMLEEPCFATLKALKRAGMRIEDIDLYEVNEAFAPIPLAWLEVTRADPAKLNVNGGAIALGHPLGATGAKLMATLINALRARGKRFGLQAMCQGGGVANVTLIEAL